MQATRNVVVNKQQSLVLMKNMIRISMSSICYHRDLFPASCFKKREYGGDKTSIHTLEPAHEADGDIIVANDDAFLLTQWLERGVFSAIEDSYLEQMTFAIFTKDPKTEEDKLIETYEFKLRYPEESEDGTSKPAAVNGVELTKQSLKAQANKFVRSLIEFSSTLEEIPEYRFVTLQLSYVDGTPSEYQPEYFKNYDGKSYGFSALSSVDTDVIKIRIGNLRTEHHDLQVNFAGLEHLDADTLFKERPSPMSSPGATERISTSAEQPKSPFVGQIYTSNGMHEREIVLNSLAETFDAQESHESQEIEWSPIEPKPEPEPANIDATPMEPMEDGNDDYRKVRSCILTEGSCVIPDVMSICMMKRKDLLAIIQRLVKTGFLTRKGRRYMLGDREAGACPKKEKSVPRAPPAPMKSRSRSPLINENDLDETQMSDSQASPILNRTRRNILLSQEGEDMETMDVSPLPVRLTQGDRSRYPLSDNDNEMDDGDAHANKRADIPPLANRQAGDGKSKGKGKGKNASASSAAKASVPTVGKKKASKRKRSVIRDPVHLYKSQRNDSQDTEMDTDRIDYTYPVSQ